MTCPEDINSGLKTLQDLCLVAEPAVRGLFWRIESSDAPFMSCPGDAVPILRRGQTILFDTFINCFYEAYWRHLTCIERIFFEIVTSGNCTIKLVSRCDDQPEAVHILSASGDRCRSLVQAPSGGASGGVLHVEVTACSGSVTVHRGQWATIESQTNDVSLAIVICSFGRDDMVAETLTRIAGLAAALDAIRHIFVIHQGQSDLTRHPTIAALEKAGACGHKLQIIRQDNFGGSGGFTRGIIEALRLEVTNILLMDDDVRVEPFVIARLSVLLAYLREPVTIGGQMLDLRKPTVLWASHEQVDIQRLALVNPFKGSDLTRVDVTSLFRNRHVSFYNGWWFCCLPAIALEHVGLPLPMFIRHDDVEHGVRMTDVGRQVVTMPGLFVWHDAHEFKSKPWLTYYEHRNFLINAALHGRVSSLRASALMAAQAWAGLTRYRYEYCWAACKAAEDYLRGPSVVFSDPRDRHRKIVAETARYTLQAVQVYRTRKETMLARSRKISDASRTIDFLRSLILSSPQSTLARALVFQIARMAVNLFLFGPRVASNYRALASNYSNIAFWKNYLKLGAASESQEPQ